MVVSDGLVVSVTVRWPAWPGTPLAEVHRSRCLGGPDVIRLDGMPVTSRSRTIVDLASSLSTGELAHLIDAQLGARTIRLEQLRSVYERVGQFRAGSGPVLRQLLDERGPGFVAPESELEEAFVALVERSGLPPPVRQFAAPWLATERGRVDFAYPAARVVVEVDGRRWHSRDEAAQRDRWRDRQAQLAGWMVLRYGWDEITSTGESGEEVANEIRRAVTQRRATGTAA